MALKVNRITNIDSVHAFRITDIKGGVATYSSEVIPMPWVQEIDFQIDKETVKARGGGRVVERASGDKTLKLKIKFHKVTNETKVALLGYTKLASGLVVDGVETPEVGLIFKGYDNRGQKTVFVFYRGQFDEPSEQFKQRDEKPDFGDTTLEGEFYSVGNGTPVFGSVEESTESPVDYAEIVSEAFGITLLEEYSETDI